MSKLPPFTKWMLQYVTGMLLVVPVAFLVAPHLLLRIPVWALGGLCVNVCVVMVVFAPLVYFSNRHRLRSGNCKPLFVVVGLIGEAMCLVLFYYAYKFGLVRANVAQGCVIAAAIGLPAALALDYYVGQKVFPNFFRPRNDSGTP